MADPNAVSGLIDDVEEVMARRSEGSRAANLRQVTNLFLGQAEGLDEERAAVFGEVMGRLAAGAEAGPRAELAARLADAPNAPPGLVRDLARDEIAVAAPLLARSNRLTDADLAAIAAAKGPAHRLAITEREHLAEAVTDALVSAGDRAVAHALACHPSARLSEAASAALVERANADGTLRTLLVGRPDLPASQARQLLDAGGGGRGALAFDLDGAEGKARFGRALAQVETLAELRPLTEDDLTAFLAAEEVAEAVCALALIAGLPVSVALRLFEPGRADLLLLVAKSQRWAWDTVQGLLALQTGEGAEPDPRLREAYASLEPATAGRVVQALTARTRGARPEPRQIRSKVR